MNKKKNFYKILVILVLILMINFIGNLFFYRFDITQDQRYTLSSQTKEIVANIDQPILVEVYLNGNFPAEFKRLQLETTQILEELQSLNSNLVFKIIDPLPIADKLIENGLTPSRLNAQENGSVSETIIFPWAVIHYKNRFELVSLLKNNFLGDTDEQLQQSIQNLEFAFADGFQKLTVQKSKKIAVLRGNGELDDIFLADFLQQLGTQYHLAPFTLDSVANNPIKTLQQLSNFDLVIIAKPTQKFTEEEKFTLDQFLMKGGKTLWLVDQVQAELDSLMVSGASPAIARDLNLTDLLFAYGLRINFNLVQDLYSSKIMLATGNIGNQPQYKQFLWNYFPLIMAPNNHVVNKNMEPIQLKFPSSIDTLSNPIKKTILLESSALSKLEGVPTIISLESILNKPNPEHFKGNPKILGVLLEGNFESGYKNRVQPFKILDFKTESLSTKMIVIADGDIIANQVYQGKPMPLGQDKWTNSFYGNKAFLLNAVNYLLDDDGLISIRNKTLEIKLLDKEKAYTERNYWKIFNFVVPLFLLSIIAFIVFIYRKKRFQSP
jgi:gliding-associated putative ABC transporter substrate-binding component GldG